MQIRGLKTQHTSGHLETKPKANMNSYVRNLSCPLPTPTICTYNVASSNGYEHTTTFGTTWPLFKMYPCQQKFSQTTPRLM